MRRNHRGTAAVVHPPSQLDQILLVVSVPMRERVSGQSTTEATLKGYIEDRIQFNRYPISAATSPPSSATTANWPTAQTSYCPPLTTPRLMPSPPPKG